MLEKMVDGHLFMRIIYSEYILKKEEKIHFTNCEIDQRNFDLNSALQAACV